MDSGVPIATAWSATQEQLQVWRLGNVDPLAYLLVAPHGWIRLALPIAQHQNPSMWSMARSTVDDWVTDHPVETDAWTVVPVSEIEHEVAEFGPMVPAPPDDGDDSIVHRTNATVWRLDNDSEPVGWLVADLDSYDATLALSAERAAQSAWRTAAREFAQECIKRLPGRARWRLRIVGEAPGAEYQSPPPLPEPEDLPAYVPASAGRRPSAWAALGVQQRLPPAGPIALILLVVLLCGAIWFGIDRIRNRGAGESVPALAAPTPASTGQGLRVGATALVVSPRLTPLRKSAGDQSKPADDVILLTAEGEVVQIDGGPETVGGRRWWRVTFDGRNGWLPETLADGSLVLAAR